MLQGICGTIFIDKSWERKVMKRMLMMSVCAMVAAAGATSADPVTSDDLLKAQDNGKEWLTYGRDYRNWRYSPLTEITPETASKLTPVWAMSTGGQLGGLEATPLFRDGVLYFSADYARTFAVDAKSGNILWHYDPEYGDGLTPCSVLRPYPSRRCAGGDLVIVARLDARLVALNQRRRKIVWDVPIDDWKHGVTTNSRRSS